jgi:hypothetical protein
MKLLIMQTSLASRHFLPLASEYCPHNPVPKHPQPLNEQHEFDSAAVQLRSLT